MTAVGKAHGNAEIPTRAGRRPARPAPIPRHCHSGCRGLERAGPTLLSTLPSSSQARRPHPLSTSFIPYPACLLPSSPLTLHPSPSHPLPAWDTLTGSFADPAHQFTCGAFRADAGSLATRSQKRKEGRTPPSSCDVRLFVSHIKDLGWEQCQESSPYFLTSVVLVISCLRGSCSNQTSFI